MLELTRRHTAVLQQAMQAQGIDLAVLADEDTIAYFGGFWGYLGVEYGRPTLLLVPRDAAPTVITPLMEAEMGAAMTWIEDVRPWEDGGDRGWEHVLRGYLESFPASIRLGRERWRTPQAGLQPDRRIPQTGRTEVRSANTLTIKPFLARTGTADTNPTEQTWPIRPR